MRAPRINDERRARAELHQPLEKYPEVAGEARHAEEALAISTTVLGEHALRAFEGSRPQIHGRNSGPWADAAGTIRVGMKLLFGDAASDVLRKLESVMAEVVIPGAKTAA